MDPPKKNFEEEEKVRESDRREAGRAPPSDGERSPRWSALPASSPPLQPSSTAPETTTRSGSQQRSSQARPRDSKPPRLFLYSILDDLADVNGQEAVAQRLLGPVPLPLPSSSNPSARSSSMTNECVGEGRCSPREGSRWTSARDDDEFKSSCTPYRWPFGSEDGPGDHYDPLLASSNNAVTYDQHRQQPPALPSAAVAHSQERERASEKPSRRRRAMTSEEKRKARTCVVDDCSNYIVHRQRCFRHGVRNSACALLRSGRMTEVLSSALVTGWQAVLLRRLHRQREAARTLLAPWYVRRERIAILNSTVFRDSPLL